MPDLTRNARESKCYGLFKVLIKVSNMDSSTTGQLHPLPVNKEKAVGTAVSVSLEETSPGSLLGHAFDPCKPQYPNTLIKMVIPII